MRGQSERSTISGRVFASSISSRPLDRPNSHHSLMNALDEPVWLHPERNAKHPDYLDKERLYQISWTFGWPYVTSLSMARLVF
jgi:hypothetical protein